MDETLDQLRARMQEYNLAFARLLSAIEVMQLDTTESVLLRPMFEMVEDQIRFGTKQMRSTAAKYESLYGDFS